MPRQKPHFKVRTTIQNHRKMPGVYDDDALLAMWVRIGILAVERFADRQDNRVYISARDLLRITGAAPVSNALRKLGRLLASSPLELSRDGAWYVLTLPNFAEKQGFGARNGAKTERSASASATATKEEEEEDVGSPPTVELQSVVSLPAEPERPRRRSAPPSWATDCAALLRDRLRENVPGARLPSSNEPWAIEIARIPPRDATPEADWPGMIRDTIEWLFGDDNRGEFAFVVHSGKALREKFSRVMAKRTADQRKRPHAAHQGSRLIAWANGYITGDGAG